MAACIHGIVAPDHFAEWWGYGAFFLVAGIGQGLFGAMLLFGAALDGESILRRWPAPRVAALCWAGILGNAAIIALWLVTRTVGIPLFGPEAGVVEPVRFLDAASKLVEAALVALLALQLRAASHSTKN